MKIVNFKSKKRKKYHDSAVFDFWPPSQQIRENARAFVIRIHKNLHFSTFF